MEKFGFVYIWRDRKHSRYYVGSHWNRVDDGYVCSSSWMRNARKRRPQDFKRRILEKHDLITYRQLLDREEVWLQKIQDHELGKRYYNLHKTTHHWASNEQNKLTIREKLKANHWSKKPGYVNPTKGKPLSEAHKEKLRHANTGKKKPPLSIEQRQKIAENSKRLQKEGKIGMLGKKHRPETIEKMKKAQGGANNPMFGKKHSEERRQKISAAGRNRIWSEASRKKASCSAIKRGIPEETRIKSHMPEVNKRRSETMKRKWANLKDAGHVGRLQSQP